MNKAESILANKKLLSEITSLTPSTLITLYEIDLTDIFEQKGINIGNRFFRFHNNLKIGTTSIYWKDQEFIASPIKAEGFELSAKGVLPTPKLSLNVNAEGVLSLSILKEYVRKLDDLIGAKVTRIRTFAKYLDARNFYYPGSSEPLDAELVPNGFAPDSNVEFPRDVYYIDRKSTENKFLIEFELASILDLEGIKLPRRFIAANRCSARYRGEGCFYDYLNNVPRQGYTHLNPGEVDVTFPNSAPPIATDNDELIKDIIGQSPRKPSLFLDANLSKYQVGDSVYFTRSNINYYFVCKVSPALEPPPNIKYWISDACSHSLRGCRIRYGVNGSATANPHGYGIPKGQLPFNGFPSTNKVQ